MTTKNRSQKQTVSWISMPEIQRRSLTGTAKEIFLKAVGNSRRNQACRQFPRNGPRLPPVIGITVNEQ